MSDVDQLTDDVLAEVREERERQEHKWGPQAHAPNDWLVILGEEFGESCRASIENDFDHLETELIQVAAVAVATIECIRRHRDNLRPWPQNSLDVERDDATPDEE